MRKTYESHRPEEGWGTYSDLLPSTTPTLALNATNEARKQRRLQVLRLFKKGMEPADISTRLGYASKKRIMVILKEEGILDKRKYEKETI